ncbi:hypothetical protein [uncultured Bacteroides sp.]|uniref:hypothetical protein n=1 Tax=uncultured Bacteroides sp. TaxID=162156 RepID=UPI0026147A42|nr:hypothetical protein [uncultured Bacteroides sp.]
MCKIRIIIQNEKKEVERDYTIEFNNPEIHIIDRPAFCIYTPKNCNGYESILFKYSNLKEETLEANMDNTEFSVIYGKISGCLYGVSFRNYNNRDIGLLSKKLIDSSNGVRFKSNIQNFFKLVKEIILSVSNEKS